MNRDSHWARERSSHNVYPVAGNHHSPTSAILSSDQLNPILSFYEPKCCCLALSAGKARERCSLIFCTWPPPWSTLPSKTPTRGRCSSQITHFFRITFVGIDIISICSDKGQERPTPSVRNSMLAAMDSLVGRVIAAVQVSAGSIK